MSLSLSLSLKVGDGRYRRFVDPANVALTGYWRDYSTSTWTGTTSAGASGGRVISAPTAPEAPASLTLDGLGVASTDGTDDHLRDPSLAMSSYLSASAYTMILVVRPSGGAAANANAYADQQLFCASGDQVGISWNTSGVRAWHYNGTNWTPTGHALCSADAYHFIAVTYDGTTQSIWVDGGAKVQVSRTNVAALSGVPRMARNSGSVYTVLRMAMIALANTVISDADIEGMRNFARATWPSAGLP